MRRDHPYIGDIVDGVLKALDWKNSNKKRFDKFNLGNSRTISLSELVAAIERIVRKYAALNRFPQPSGDVDQTYADITYAQPVLGYAPSTSLEEGIVKEYEWLKEALS